MTIYEHNASFWVYHAVDLEEGVQHLTAKLTKVDDGYHAWSEWGSACLTRRGHALMFGFDYSCMFEESKDPSKLTPDILAVRKPF